MIRRIDIEQFGCYQGFVWREHCGNPFKLDRLNILYGRNYSGKTSLSRILQSLATGEFPAHHDGPKFRIETDDGDLTEQDAGTTGLNIQVYNADFVRDNLSLLRDSFGQIKPFTVIGQSNKEVSDQIAALDQQLGSVEDEIGLAFEEAKKQADHRAKADEVKRSKAALESKLRDRANNVIKRDRDYGSAIYDIRRIRQDIETVRKPDYQPLNEQQAETHLALLRQDPLAKIACPVEPDLHLGNLLSQASELLAKPIKPTEALQDLLADSVLQEWVRQGTKLHRDKREACGFCRQPLPDSLWDALDGHFSEASDALRADFTDLLGQIEEEESNIDILVPDDASDLDARCRDDYKNATQALDEVKTTYTAAICVIRQSVESRLGDVFTCVDLPDLVDNSHTFLERWERITRVADQHNQYADSLEQDKEKAREVLRLHAVWAYIRDIGLDTEERTIAELEVEAERLEQVAQQSHAELVDLQAQIAGLRSQLRDERHAVGQINRYLGHYFGHPALRLAVDDTNDPSGASFVVQRHGQTAHHLSEGECSLIAFCYFITKLKDAAQMDDGLPIIYIDDPISSLDGNHVFFIYSLIESEVAQRIEQEDGSNALRYHQLFVATHNLDLLKYLRKLTSPKQAEGECRYLLVEGGQPSSRIIPMPKYLKEYVTEFNYLFEQIYKCREAVAQGEDAAYVVGFGNNLRKFLEAYLFYRYPNAQSLDTRIRRFFGDESSSVLVQRLVNEFSHLGEAFDRGMQPVDIAEIQTLACFVTETIEAKDPEQHQAFLDCIHQ